MNKDNARDYIPLLEALADGELQIKDVTGEWRNVESETLFFLPYDRYRRKPKPIKVYVILNKVVGTSVYRDEAHAKGMVNKYGGSYKEVEFENK